MYRVNGTDVISSKSTLPHPDSNLEISDAGGVEVFAGEAAAQQRYDHTLRLVNGSPLFAEYDYLHEIILLRASFKLTPSYF